MILLYNEAHGEMAVMGWTAEWDEEIAPGGCWTDAGGKNRAINAMANPHYFQRWQPLPAPPQSPQ